MKEQGYNEAKLNLIKNMLSLNFKAEYVEVKFFILIEEGGKITEFTNMNYSVLTSREDWKSQLEDEDLLIFIANSKLAEYKKHRYGVVVRTSSEYFRNPNY